MLPGNDLDPVAMTNRCPSCAGEIPEGSRFCNACGEALSPSSETATRTSAKGGAPGADLQHTGDSRPSFPSLDQARFLPGTMLAGRYRIVSLLGRGGMGEVYRADDLKLGQPVALKFLPEGLERDPRRLERFLNEVRVALRVSHPNVCRVYDIGEFEGHHYLSMEYVDGEDLSSLLRRIGRFPRDKAGQAARQLCAGLAAAHDQGVLHRDLKPANVMIDGRGRVKITDFGLAELQEAIHGAEARAGTPAYMAPEQLAGREANVRSDIYALGLVLYELFTGRAALSGRTPDEIARLQQETTPTTPSSLVEGIDPAVERVILLCLEKDPLRRPTSALAVAAALPGGDPLAAALAAGETPSPELVAEAGETGGLKPAVAVACLAAILIGLALTIWLSERRDLLSVAPLDKPPEVLTERAREIILELGYDNQPADSLGGFFPNLEYLDHLGKREDPAGQWDGLGNSRPAAVVFWYRQSPSLLARKSPGAVGDGDLDPPLTLPGMLMVTLDPLGRLQSFTAVPPVIPAAGAPVEEPDWTAVLARAGLHREALTSVDPLWSPPVYADRRLAWQGVYPDAPETEIRIEAATLQGRLVWFRIIEPWARPALAASERVRILGQLTGLIPAISYLFIVLGAGFIAWRNVRLGRGDRQTAIRFALYLGAMRFLWFFGAHHLPSAAELEIIISNLAWALYRVGLIWVFYLALEPYARRLWPRTLVSWVRLFDRRFRDPLVGRDILIGSVIGVFMTVALHLGEYLPGLAGMSTPPPLFSEWSFESVLGMRHAVTAAIGAHVMSVQNTFFGILLFLVLRLLLRRTYLAITVATVISAGIFYTGHGNLYVYLLVLSLVMAFFWSAFFRFGLLTVIVAFSVYRVLLVLPLSFDLSSWRVEITLLAVLLVMATAVYGFRAALAGRPVFRDQLAAQPTSER
jgi:serine/threonine-protein kinase